MEDDLIELPSLVVDVEEEEAVAGMDDTDLDAVSDQVDAIQQNIKNLFATDEQASAGEFAEDDGDSEASDIEQQSEPEVVEQIESVATEPTLQSGLEPGSGIQSSPDDNRS